MLEYEFVHRNPRPRICRHRFVELRRAVNIKTEISINAIQADFN